MERTPKGLTEEKMAGRAYSTKNFGSPNDDGAVCSSHECFRSSENSRFQHSHANLCSLTLSNNQLCRRCPDRASNYPIGLFQRLEKYRTDSERSDASSTTQRPSSMYRSGYDNLAVGHFMPQQINSGVNTSVIKNALPRLRCLKSSNMHLDILPSPVGSSNSPLHNNLSSSASPFTEMSPDSNYIHSGGNKDPYDDTEGLEDSNLLCYNHDLLCNYPDDMLANLIATDHLYSSYLDPSSYPSDMLHSNDLSSIFLSPQSSSVNTPPSELPLSPSPMEKDQVVTVKPETLLPSSSRDFVESSSGVQMAPPLPMNYSDLSSYPTSFANPRHSYSSRSSRNKRSLSISPLSAEGLDLNAIIRMSPTSLVAYLGGSHSSSSSMSPAGDKTGCYGHLSARNSTGSPQSTFSGPRLSSYSQNQLPVIRDDSLGLDSNLAVYQSMEMLESNCFLANTNTTIPSNQVILSQEDSAQFLESQRVKSEPYSDSCLYSAESSGTLPPQVPIHPPPSYDQHMARKLKFQKKNSSDSSQSQPSSYSSFDSSEGERAADGTDTEQGKPHYICRWVDCVSTTFSNQDELVKHIEKCHIDQRKGEDFACFWQSCPRRYRPFNARYKLLIHMRVHTGEKPNKCTFEGCSKAFSRLENLKIHLRSHTGERPYVCQYTGCCKAFSNSSDRAKHQRTHQDTKPYACQVPGCTKRYTDPSSLRKHVKNHSAKADPAKKKLRSGMSEIDAELLSECLVIQPIVPIHQTENSSIDNHSLPEIHSHSKCSTGHQTGIPTVSQISTLERRTDLHRGEAMYHSSFSSRIPVLPPIRHSMKQEMPGPKSINLYSYRESDSAGLMNNLAKDCSRKVSGNFPSIFKQDPEGFQGNVTLPPLEEMATNFASFDSLSHFGGIS